MEITSLNHPLVKKFTKLVHSKEFRLEEKRVVLAGEKRIFDLSRKIPYGTLLIDKEIPHPAEIANERILFVPKEILKKITHLDSPPTMLADFPMPSENNLERLDWILVLEGIQDPGNLGTLFRTAQGLGWEGIFLLPGCADPFNDKALRASEGATLLFPFRSGSITDFFSFLQNNKLPAFVATLGGALPQKIERGVLILGSEGKGVSPEISKSYSIVSIPMKAGQNSLNVSAAGAILMAFMKGI